VTLCGTAASAVTWVSSTQLLAVAGAAPGTAACTGDVSVLSDAHGGGTLAGGFTYRVGTLAAAATRGRDARPQRR
jgi:hypothetical protein